MQVGNGAFPEALSSCETFGDDAVSPPASIPAPLAWLLPELMRRVASALGARETLAFGASSKGVQSIMMQQCEQLRVTMRAMTAVGEVHDALAVLDAVRALRRQWQPDLLCRFSTLPGWLGYDARASLLDTWRVDVSTVMAWCERRAPSVGRDIDLCKVLIAEWEITQMPAPAARLNTLQRLETAIDRVPLCFWPSVLASVSTSSVRSSFLSKKITHFVGHASGAIGWVPDRVARAYAEALWADTTRRDLRRTLHDAMGVSNTCLDTVVAPEVRCWILRDVRLGRARLDEACARWRPGDIAFLRTTEKALFDAVRGVVRRHASFSFVMRNAGVLHGAVVRARLPAIASLEPATFAALSADAPHIARFLRLHDRTGRVDSGTMWRTLFDVSCKMPVAAQPVLLSRLANRLRSRWFDPAMRRTIMNSYQHWYDALPRRLAVQKNAPTSVAWPPELTARAAAALMRVCARLHHGEPASALRVLRDTAATVVLETPPSSWADALDVMCALARLAGEAGTDLFERGALQQWVIDFVTAPDAIAHCPSPSFAKHIIGAAGRVAQLTSATEDQHVSWATAYCRRFDLPPGSTEAVTRSIFHAYERASA